MSTRPIILGMNSPISMAPEHALYPHPPGCTGHQLWMMLNERTGASKSQYLRAFDRRNLLTGEWDRRRAAEAGERLLHSVTGRVIVVLGGEVRRAIRLPKQLIHPIEMYGATWRQLPHPSGRNMWYNSVECRALAAALLAELYALANVREDA